KIVKNITKEVKFIYIFLIGVFSIVILLGIDIKIFGSKAIPKRSDCIIVLGCSVYGTVPSPFLKGRLQHATGLYSEGYADYIIVSGGQGAGEDISEAEAMKNYLLIHGMDENKIIVEDRSTSTYENLKYSKEEMDKRSLRDAIIVSNEF